MDRRDALKILAGASLSTFASRSEALAASFEFLPTTLTPETLAEQKRTAATELLDAEWQQPHLREFVTSHYLDHARTETDALKTLEAESRMYLPSPEETADVIARNAQTLDALAAATPEGRFGLFVDGDKQRLYVLQRETNGTARFIKAYHVSTSLEAWSNDPSSGGTPIGLHHIAEEHAGLFGEVVAASGAHGNVTRLRVHEHGHTVVRAFVNGLTGSDSKAAEMVTRRFLLVGPTTPPSRAINIHGTNRIELLGRRGSGGCIRESNVDVTDLAQYVDVGRWTRMNSGVVLGGTPVMIQATWEHSTDPERRAEEKKDNVPHKKRENLFDLIK